LRCGDNFSPRIGNVEAFGARGRAYLWVSVKTNSFAAAISNAATGGAGSDPAQN
jgi:hypothetical protein